MGLKQYRNLKVLNPLEKKPSTSSPSFRQWVFPPFQSEPEFESPNEFIIQFDSIHVEGADLQVQLARGVWGSFPPPPCARRRAGVAIAPPSRSEQAKPIHSKEILFGFLRRVQPGGRGGAGQVRRGRHRGVEAILRHRAQRC